MFERLGRVVVGVRDFKSEWNCCCWRKVNTPPKEPEFEWRGKNKKA